MASPVMHFEGVEANYINPDRLARTVRFVSTSQNPTSYGELLNGLCAAGIEPDEINGIYKVSAYDHSYSIQCKYSDTVEKLIELKKLTCGRANFEIMKMTEQVVNLRIHWLPLFYDNLILEEIFGQYGEILDIEMLKTSHEKLVAFNGTRQIKMKVTEFQKQLLPHIVYFNSGQAILVTMAGRPPYCLKCKSIGHVRQRCPHGNRSYAMVSRSENMPTMQDSVADGSAPTQTPEALVAPVSEPSDLGAGAMAPAEAETECASGSLASGQDQQGENLEMDLDPERGMKRGREVRETTDSWITPNKTARSRTRVEQPLPLDNSFSPILTVDDLVDS